MGAIAVAELIVPAPVERAFSSFIDYSSWDQWMPPSFRPVSGPARALREADEVIVGVGPGGKLVGPANIIRVRPNKEVCWRGGSRWNVLAEHSFFFSESDGQTRIRSEELLSGLLARGPIARFLENEATRVGGEILTAFAAHLRKRG